MDPAPGAAAEGVSTEADSGSRGGAGRAARRGRAQKFPAQLSLPPSSARARCGCSRGEAAAAAAAAGRAQGARHWAIAVGARAVGSGRRLPGARPSAAGGGRKRAAGEGPAPPPQNEPAVGHRHERRFGVPARPAAQLGLPVASGHAPGERLRCLSARAACWRRAPRAGLREGPPGAAGLAPALQLSQQLLPAAARRGGCSRAPPPSVDRAGPFPIGPALPGLARPGSVLPGPAWLGFAQLCQTRRPMSPGRRERVTSRLSWARSIRARAGPSCSLSQPGAPCSEGTGGSPGCAGGSGFSPDSPGAARAESPFQVSFPRPTPSPSWPPLAGTGSADSALSSSAGA